MALFQNGFVNTNLYLSADPTTGGGVINVSNNAASAALPLLFQGNGTTRMTLDASGNLGVGTTSPRAVSGYSSIGVNGTTGGLFDIFANGTRVATFGADTTVSLSSITNIPLTFGTNNTERARITSGGDLAVGLTAPSARLHARVVADTESQIAQFENLNVAGTDSHRLQIKVDASANSVKYESTGSSAGSHIFVCGNDERARITSGGDLLVGLTGFTYSNEKLAVLADNNQEAAAFKTDAGATTYAIVVSNTATSGDNKFVAFATETTDTIRGSITYNRGAGQVAYNITSDARLKENIADSADAGGKIDAMQVRQFDWKETGNHLDYGFVAQELHAVAPHAVSKPEDEDAMWSVDYSKLVPMLIKEVQSLRKRVAELEYK